MAELDENVPAFDAQRAIEEQKAVINALNEKIKNLESRNAASEEKIAALSATPKTIAAVPAKSAADEAYEKTLRELGITPSDR